jgi:hypothetical protein
MFPAHEQIEKLLQQLREGQHLHDNSPITKSDQILNSLCHKNSADLQYLQAKLSIKAKKEL